MHHFIHGFLRVVLFQHRSTKIHHIPFGHQPEILNLSVFIQSVLESSTSNSQRITGS